MCSPFLGGASFELLCASRGIQVFGYDAFLPLINFWDYAQMKPIELAIAIKEYYPLTKETFRHLQEEYHGERETIETLKYAAIFYVLNRSSFSGIGLSEGMSLGHPRFTESEISRVADFYSDHLVPLYGDFSDSIPRHGHDFLYCAPPYANGGQGGTEKGFDHLALSELLKNRSRWMLSYNDCPFVRELYDGCLIESLSWKYGTSRNKTSNEVLIMPPL